MTGTFPLRPYENVLGMWMAARRFADSVLGLEERQNRHEDQGPRQDPDYLHDLLFPWRRPDQMTGLEILEIVSAHRGGAANDCSDHQRGRRSRRMSGSHEEHEQQSGDHDGGNRHA